MKLSLIYITHLVTGV